MTPEQSLMLMVLGVPAGIFVAGLAIGFGLGYWLG